MSTHAVNVIEIKEVRPHANAERLEIVPVGGWQAVVKKGQFTPGDRAIYIEPDYTVPTAREEFAFLSREGQDRHRLRAVRLRGVLSFGLLIPVPADLADAPVGSNVMELLGIERYVPPVKEAGGDDLPEDQLPRVYTPVFDVENRQRFLDCIAVGEPVIITEKVHGANARYLFHDGVFYMGSRTRWLRPEAIHIWRQAADAEPSIRRWCEENRGAILYGEIYGRVQSLKYGRSNDIAFAAFAALRQDRWLNLEPLFAELAEYGVPTVPVLKRGPFEDRDLDLAEGDSLIVGAPHGHMMEGIVITPLQERRDERLGRVALKHISARYWTGEDGL